MQLEFCVVLVTTPGEDVAHKIARILVEEGLAACVNIVREVRSIYRWKGNIEDEKEALMIIKTRFELFGTLKEKIKSLHPYSVVEIIALPIWEGIEEYLDWIRKETRASPNL